MNFVCRSCMKVSFYVLYVFCCSKCLRLMSFFLILSFSCWSRKIIKIEFNEVRSVTFEKFKLNYLFYFLEIPSPNCPNLGGI